jgi:hypothetical protein
MFHFKAQFSGRTYVSVGWLVITSAFISHSPQYFLHYYRGAHEMKVMLFTKNLSGASPQAACNICLSTFEF